MNEVRRRQYCVAVRGDLAERPAHENFARAAQQRLPAFEGDARLRLTDVAPQRDQPVIADGGKPAAWLPGDVELNSRIKAQRVARADGQVEDLDRTDVPLH